MDDGTDRKAVAFDSDVDGHGGYIYTTNRRLSSFVANRRQTDAVLGIVDLAGKTVLDIGCGDGTYTVELYDRGQPARMHGIDAAPKAIEVASSAVGNRRLVFSAGSAYELPFATNSFDVAHLRGVLHHLDRPVQALQEAFRVASTVVFLEPNGYNPVLKAIERLSTYHREHQERSYAPHRLDRWVTIGCGATVAKRIWTGFVPFFCPHVLARLLKLMEPGIERLPGIRCIVCGNYTARCTRGGQVASG